MDLKNIKVTEKVKSELDDIAYDKETYNVTIERLIRENKKLFLENHRLHFDKEVLTKLLLKDDELASPTILHKYVPFIESMLFDSELSDIEKLNNLKKYFGEIDDVDYEIITSCIAIVKDTHNLTSGALIEFETWINEQYH